MWAIRVVLKELETTLDELFSWADGVKHLGQRSIHAAGFEVFHRGLQDGKALRFSIQCIENVPATQNDRADYVFSLQKNLMERRFSQQDHHYGMV